MQLKSHSPFCIYIENVMIKIASFIAEKKRKFSHPNVGQYFASKVVDGVRHRIGFAGIVGSRRRRRRLQTAQTVARECPPQCLQLKSKPRGLGSSVDVI